MRYKFLVRFMVLVAILLVTFAGVGSAYAWGGCGSTYVVQWGDSLSGIAAACGTTVNAIFAVNPNLGWYIYAGQVINLPGYYQTGYYQASYYTAPTYYAQPVAGQSYVIQPGDTLANIASRIGSSVQAVMANNPQIWNPSVIYVGQVIQLPAAPTYYTVCRGDTLFSIATRFGTTTASLQYLNGLWNPNWIYAGQVLRIH